MISRHTPKSSPASSLAIAAQPSTNTAPSTVDARTTHRTACARLRIWQEIVASGPLARRGRGREANVPRYVTPKRRDPQRSQRVAQQISCQILKG